MNRPLRRIAVYFTDTIEERELVAMAEAFGFFVRHVDGITIIDRVPNWVRKPADNVLHLPRKAKP